MTYAALRMASVALARRKCIRRRRLAAGGGILVVAGAGAEEVVELVVAATKAYRRAEALEASHTSYAPFDAAVVLLQSIALMVWTPPDGIDVPRWRC